MNPHIPFRYSRVFSFCGVCIFLASGREGEAVTFETSFAWPSIRHICNTTNLSFVHRVLKTTS
jgi:hypothetical protein